MTILTLLCIDTSFIAAMPTVTISALSGHANQRNAGEHPKMTAGQAS